MKFTDMFMYTLIIAVLIGAAYTGYLEYDKIRKEQIIKPIAETRCEGQNMDLWKVSGEEYWCRDKQYHDLFHYGTRLEEIP